MSARSLVVLVVLVLSQLVACGDDDAARGAPDAAASDGSSPIDARLEDAPAMSMDATRDATPDAAAPTEAGAEDMSAIDAGAPDARDLDAGPTAPCPRALRPADADRFVVVSHPYGDDGSPAGVYEVLGLSRDGTLSRIDSSFAMGRSTGGRIELTPDGEVGLVAQEDGTLGVFVLDESGRATVVHAGLEGSFYAASVMIDADGQGAWVLDAQWRESGGGLYRVAIGCDATVTDLGRVAEAKLPYAMARIPGREDRLVLAATDVLGSPTDLDLHLLSASAPPGVVASSDVFDDDEAIVSSLAVTADGTYALIGDGNAFSGIPNRVGVAVIQGDLLAPVQVLSPIEDPIAIVASPFDASAIVVSGFGNAIFVLQRETSPVSPFSVAGELAYVGRRPQLPGGAVMIERGALRGRVLVAENLGVRSVAFEPAGPRDLGLFAIGDGLTSIVGAIGVSP